MKTIRLRGKSYPLAPIYLILLGAALWPEMELLVPSLPAMKVFFQVSDGEIQQLLTANFIGFLCGVLFAGPLCDSLGRKNTTVWGMFLFLLASLAAALTNDFSALMVARFLQGLAVTAPIIGGSTMLLELTTGDRQIFWMSMSSAWITLCMAAAPLLGAFINGMFGFKGNLWAIFIVAFMGILPVIFWVPETLEHDKKSPLNAKNVALGYLALLRHKQFMGLSFIMAALAGAYWIYTGVSALYMVDYLHIDANLFGLYQGPIVATFAVLSLSISSIHQRMGSKTCFVAGALMMVLGLLPLWLGTLVGLENALFTTVCMMMFVGGIVPYNSLLFPTALNLLPAEFRGSGQSLVQALRLLLASVGTSILGITYTGPFLPVAHLLVILVAISLILLWKMRHVVSNNLSS